MLLVKLESFVTSPDGVTDSLVFVDYFCRTTLPDFDVHVTVHRAKFLTIKPTRYTNFSNLFLE